MRKSFIGLIFVFFFSLFFLNNHCEAVAAEIDEAAFGGQITKAGTYLENFFGIVIRVCLWERPEGNLYLIVIDDCGKLFCSEFVWEVRKGLPKNAQELEKAFNKEFSDLVRKPIKLKLFKKYPEPCWNDKVLEIYVER